MAAAGSPFERWFDELSVGDRFETASRTIAEDDLTAFAELTGDRHPLHLDAEWAASSAFGERVAHGMLVLSCAIGLLPIDPDRVLTLRSLERVTFKAPVPIGTTIRATGEVSDTKPLDDEVGLVHLRWEVTGTAGKPVVRLGSAALWRRAPAA